ncbi:MAG: aminomethyl-transferring glycine dehydrogenase subunit GcvPA [Pseudomonadota bacterium]|nr:aminomethyl-transferring glycine dehydrogenase subunit GcvPA [Pseudomonadota bacterium]
MPNSVPTLKAEMLRAIGAGSVEELFEQIPEDHRYRKPLDLPPALSSEPELRRHLLKTLSRNASCEENLNFLGGGCWQHHVPAICDEIVGRSEFLTPVWGTPSSDFGRNQAWFEFQSQLGELLGMELVGLPVYSWGCAAGHAIRMAARMTGRREILVPAAIAPERLSVIRNYCEPAEMASHLSVVPVGYDPRTGLLDLADLRAKLSRRTAAIYIENPSFLGVIETQAAEIAALARSAGAETIVGVDPISLGILAAPADYGADIAVGSTQPLGVHMNCGGGVGGFIASRDEVRYAREYPTLLLSITDTMREGEFGFGISLFHQSSYGSREKGKDWTGNSTYLWAIASAVYMSLMGPEGFREIGELIIQRAHYAARLLSGIDGVEVRFPTGFFKEFVVDFSATGRTVGEINKDLLKHGIFGGKDLSADFPQLGQSALYCVTEVHGEADIETLAEAVKEVCST